MNADAIIQKLAVEIYRSPLSKTRSEIDYPNLANPLHLAILLIDFDGEIEMNGILGFLENSTGRYLKQTIEALNLIGAPKSAALLDSVQSCLTKFGVTWESLRSDSAGIVEYQITSFRETHGESSDEWSEEVLRLSGNFCLFNAHYALEDSYGSFCQYLDCMLDDLQTEIEKRKTPDLLN